jgi:hypothetical protein
LCATIDLATGELPGYGDPERGSADVAKDFMKTSEYCLDNLILAGTASRSHAAEARHGIGQSGGITTRKRYGKNFFRMIRKLRRYYLGFLQEQKLDNIMGRVPHSEP